MSDVLALGDVADVVAGVGFPKDMQGGQDGAIPVFKVGDISAAWLQGKSLLNDSRNYLSTEEAKSLGKCVPAGSTVFAKIGEALRLNRRVMLGRDALVDNNVMGLVPMREKVAPKYLYYFMQTVDLGELSRSTTVPSIRKSDVVEIRIPVPELAAQNAIVAELEKQFSRLDEAVANLQRVKANLKRYKASVLKAAVEGRLVETEATLARREGRTYETGEQLLQRMHGDKKVGWNGRGSFKLPVAPETAELSEVPEGWAWASIDQLAAPSSRSITDGPFGSNLKSAHYVEAGPRVIRLQNIKDGEFDDAYAHITQEHFESLRKHEVFAGDLVIASLGENPPRACIIPASVGPAIVKADCIRFKAHPALTLSYLNAALNCQPTRTRVKDVLHGIGRPRLSLGEIRAIALPIPPAAEQTRIVAEVDRNLSIIREVEAEINANLQRAQALRQATLAKAFSTGTK